jgi:arylsulfatase
MDIMPTCLELAGASYPGTYEGHEITAKDGHSLVPVMSGKTVKNYEDLFFEHEGGKALISGNYKIVALAKGEWALYNLAKDNTETTNLIQSEPEKAKEMIAKWNDWAKTMGLIKN